MDLEALAWERSCCGQHRSAVVPLDGGTVTLQEMGDGSFYCTHTQLVGGVLQYKADSSRVPNGRAHMSEADVLAALKRK